MKQIFPKTVDEFSSILSNADKNIVAVRIDGKQVGFPFLRSSDKKILIFSNSDILLEFDLKTSHYETVLKIWTFWETNFKNKINKENWENIETNIPIDYKNPQWKEDFDEKDWKSYIAKPARCLWMEYSDETKKEYATRAERRRRFRLN